MMRVEYSAPRYLFRRFTILRKVRKSNNFLEIGAGNLKLSSELVEYFNRGTAIDFEDSVKDYYKRLPREKIKKLELKIGDIFRIKFSEKFDCVLACEVMEHIKDDVSFMKKLSSLIKEGGQLIISVPAKQKYWTIHDEAVGHYRRYEKSDLYSMVKKSNFKNIRIYSYGFPFINIFWLLRSLHGKMQMKKRSSLSTEKRTKESGVNQIPKSFIILGLIANKYVFFVPNLISTLFNNTDLSEGYIVVADK